MSGQNLAVNLPLLPQVFRRDGYLVGRQEPFGPDGVVFAVRKGGDFGTVILTQADWDEDGTEVEWLHASWAFQDRDPTYAEMALLHRAVFGRRRFSYMVFAPEDQHVNIHQHALHLWGRADGSNAMPTFGMTGSI